MISISSNLSIRFALSAWVGSSLLCSLIAAGPVTEKSSLPPPEIEIPQAGCVTSECHPGTKDHQYLHGPLYVDACDACHTLMTPKLHQFELIRPEEQLCTFCHEFDIHPDSMQHEPFKTGGCLPCHNPHGGPGPTLLRSDHYSDLCMTCHEDLIGAKNLVHGPASTGACGACHEPHAAPNRKLLAVDGRNMCLDCHVTIEVRIENARLVHPPVKEDCQLCHDPHATDGTFLLISEPSELCMSCHDSIRHTVDTANSQHGAITTEQSCLNCHDPHTSDHPRLLKDNVMNLCFQCHDTEIEREDGSVIANMKAIIETGTSLHGPIAEGNCISCHEIHGGQNRRLLVRGYSGELYGHFDEKEYALCFGCHDSSLAMLEHTTTATGFRNGDTNLHFVHVNRDRKGRTCAVCHDSHASSRDRHINDTIPFGPGGWELPIQFEREGDGGSCASGCHTTHVYSRSNPVVYPPKPIDGEPADSTQPSD